MKPIIRIVPAVLALAAILPVRGQEPGLTREQGDAILRELRQIRQLLERGARPGAQAGPAEQTASVKIDGAPVLGNKDAPYTIVEFTDYQCTFCQRFHNSTFPELRKKYIDSGKVRFVSRDFPLDFHSNAFKAAEAARCAGDQGRFWQMRDTLVANADKLSEDQITGFAQSLKLAMPAFRSCVDGGKYRDAIQKEIAEAMSLGVNGTPSFVIGKSTPDGVDGVVLVGAQPIGAFDLKLGDLGR
jgi:protein-disulfide isomerase